MRSKLKLILTAAVVSALAVAGLSVAAGGGDGDSNSTSAGPAAPASLAAGGERARGHGPRFGRDFRDADVQAVLKEVRTAVTEQAVEIAGPVIDEAEQNGKITAAQADRLRQAAQDIQDGKRPDLRALGRDRDVHEVVHDAFAAAAKKAQEIGEPIIAKAVDDDKITEAQADRIRALLKRTPGGPGPGFKGHGRGFGPGGPAVGDADVGAVLEDVHKAVAAQADDVAKPIIDKAEADGKLTSTQADRLREAAQDLSGAKRTGMPLRGLDMRDSEVHEVLRDVFAAVAERAPGIAKPIIDKAVADDKITAAQARRIRNMLEHKGERRGAGRGHGGPPFERPGGPGGFGPGGGPPPAGSGAPQAPDAPGSPS